MFNTVLNGSTLEFMSQEATNCFQIQGDSYKNDFSFVATLRALLGDKVSADDSLLRVMISREHNLTGWGSPTETGAKNDARNIVRNWTSFDEAKNTLVIVNYACPKGTESEWMGLFRNTFLDYQTGNFDTTWLEITKVTDFFRKKMQVLCFIDAEHKLTVLFVANMNMRTQHYLQCGIPAFLPWYFEGADGLTQEQVDLIKSLRETTDTQYITIMNQMAKRYNFRALKIRRLLSDIDVRFDQIERRRIADQINTILNRIESLKTSLRGCFSDKTKLETNLIALDEKIGANSGESEIMEYFLCNNKLFLNRVDETTIEFVVQDYLSYFDEEMAQRFIENKTSYIYRPGGNDGKRWIPQEDIEMLMRAIFIDQTLRIRMCAAYSIDLAGYASAINRFQYPHDIISTYMPNTHIDSFRCMGNYERIITDLIEKHDYISVIEQCIASGKSLNLGDGTVFNEFMQQIYGISNRRPGNMRCIELPDGNVVDTKHAIAYLKAQKEKATEEV